MRMWWTVATESTSRIHYTNIIHKSLQCKCTDPRIHHIIDDQFKGDFASSSGPSSFAMASSHLSSCSLACSVAFSGVRSGRSYIIRQPSSSSLFPLPPSGPILLFIHHSDQSLAHSLVHPFNMQEPISAYRITFNPQTILSTLHLFYSHFVREHTCIKWIILIS